MARLNLKRAAKPDPDRTYEPVQSFSGPDGTYATGTRLAGDHPAVRAAFGQWMLADLPDDEKGRIRSAAMFGGQEVPAHEAPPIARQPSGKFRALVARTLADPDLASRARLSPGDIVDASDEVFKRYPHYFEPLEENR